MDSLTRFSRKRLRDYVRYTTKELEAYVKCEGSCVHKVNKNVHMAFLPYVLANLDVKLPPEIFRKKVGVFDYELNGIVLDVKKIKVYGPTCAVRFDDKLVHLNINADFYVFRPIIGSILHGTVRYISRKKNIGLIIYRVFNTTIKINASDDNDELTFDVNEEIKFRLKSFDIANVTPYIEGELLSSIRPSSEKIVIPKPDIKTEQLFDEYDDSNDSDDYDNALVKYEDYYDPLQEFEIKREIDE